MFRAGSEDIDQLQRRVREGISRLKGLEVGDDLGVELLSQLVSGKKNASEIVELIYGFSRSEEGYKSSYGRVRREICRLESKGLVSRKLFGKEKPYRLTQLAIINLARIGGEEQQENLVTRTDLAIYLIAFSLSVPVALQASNWIYLGEITTVGLFPTFCFFLGFSCSKVLQTLRRVL